MVRPLPPPATPPLISIKGSPAYPGCDVPSIRTGPVIAGNGVTGSIACTPVPGIAKSITAAVSIAPFAARRAALSEPSPLSFVFVTSKADSKRAVFHRFSSRGLRRKNTAE